MPLPHYNIIKIILFFPLWFRWPAITGTIKIDHYKNELALRPLWFGCLRVFNISRVHDFESSSSIFKSPISADLLANKCDTCGKTFSHSSSYRRHIRTSCRARKRRRLLWLPEEGESEELDSDEEGISVLSNASFADNSGKLSTSSNNDYFGRV